MHYRFEDIEAEYRLRSKILLSFGVTLIPAMTTYTLEFRANQPIKIYDTLNLQYLNTYLSDYNMVIRYITERLDSYIAIHSKDNTIKSLL